MTTPAGASAGRRRASRVDTNAPATGRLTADIVQDWSALEALAPEWNRLPGGSRANTIFLTWEWISAWRDTIGSRARPFVVGVRDEHGTLAALAPFYRTTASLLGVVPYKVLRVMADYATSAEYGSWIVRADCEAKASRTLGEALRKAQRAWDGIWMSKVAGWNGTPETVEQACRDTRLLWRSRPQTFGYTALPPTAEQYRKSLSSNKRQQLRSEHECIAAGVRGLDFLANMSEHKRRWLAEPRTGCDLFIASPTLTNRLLFTSPIWPRGLLRTVRSSSTCGLEGSDPNTSSEPEERKRKRERDDRP